MYENTKFSSFFPYIFIFTPLFCKSYSFTRHLCFYICVYIYVYVCMSVCFCFKGKHMNIYTYLWTYVYVAVIQLYSLVIYMENAGVLYFLDPMAETVGYFQLLSIVLVRNQLNA